MVAEYRWHDGNMTNNSERMLKSALTALGSQWDYVKQKPQWINAYKAGIRFSRNYFGQLLLQRLSKSLRIGQWQQARQSGVMLLRYSRLWFAALFTEISLF